MEILPEWKSIVSVYLPEFTVTEVKNVFSIPAGMEGDYYNLQRMKVKDLNPHEVYIYVRDGKARKVMGKRYSNDINLNLKNIDCHEICR